jgi:hypothetical protein
MAIKILFQENMVEIEVEVMVVGQVGGMIYQNFNVTISKNLAIMLQIVIATLLVKSEVVVSKIKQITTIKQLFLATILAVASII